jgi:hypothetical protein
MKFYAAKVICIELGIASRQTLEARIKRGLYPPYEKNPAKVRGVGYFESTFELVRQIKAPACGYKHKLSK